MRFYKDVNLMKLLYSNFVSVIHFKICRKNFKKNIDQEISNILSLLKVI